jgi:hypothetical protein
MVVLIQNAVSQLQHPCAFCLNIDWPVWQAMLVTKVAINTRAQVWNVLA